MRARILTASFVLLIAGASFAVAAPFPSGLAIRWDRCYGDGGVSNRNFACNTNAGTNNILASFMVAQDTQSLPGNIQLTLELATAANQLPSWWAFKNLGSCRVSSLSASFAGLVEVNCVDAWSGQGTGGIAAYDVGVRGPSSARVVVVGAAPVAAFIGLNAGAEYLAGRVRFDDAKTVGLGACGGCDVPVCLVVQSLRLQFQTEPELLLTAPLNGTDSHYVTWQGGGAPIPGTYAGCPAATPTRHQTWSAVKGLYR